MQDYEPMIHDTPATKFQKKTRQKGKPFGLLIFQLLGVMDNHDPLHPHTTSLCNLWLRKVLIVPNVT
jgi:hypothetical protein